MVAIGVVNAHGCAAEKIRAQAASLCSTSPTRFSITVRLGWRALWRIHGPAPQQPLPKVSSGSRHRATRTGANTQLQWNQAAERHRPEEYVDTIIARHLQGLSGVYFTDLLREASQQLFVWWPGNGGPECFRKVEAGTWGPAGERKNSCGSYNQSKPPKHTSSNESWIEGEI